MESRIRLTWDQLALIKSEIETKKKIFPVNVADIFNQGLDAAYDTIEALAKGLAEGEPPVVGLSER